MGNNVITQERNANKFVRFIYLVSDDRSVNHEYRQAIENTALDIQAWFKKQMNGLTFTLYNPIVEVIHSNKNALYFYSNPSNDNKDNWGYYNAFNEVSRILGAKFNDENYTWVIYSDGPGDKGGGTSGVCVMPENDLLGLVGKDPTQKDKNRWIGGSAHELGHALGLDHPKDTEAYQKALMWLGYESYPDAAYLTIEDKAILTTSPFFVKF